MLALVRIGDNAPPDIWASLKPETQRAWLRFGGDGQGWAGHAWNALPPETQRRLRLSVRSIFAFLGNAGCDLLGNG